MEQWRTRCLSGGGESKASSSMENKVHRPFLYLALVLRGHGYGLVRIWFPLTFIWMSVGFVFFQCEYGEGGDDRLGYRLDGGGFFVLACGGSDSEDNSMSSVEPYVSLSAIQRRWALSRNPTFLNITSSTPALKALDKALYA
ncbi:hypothetical protein EJB05_46954 [Eragrostis curvula]|uniref:Uncharacterized protein n=1 Tax=Eragrostis curvula TaxID=38414 RepID=A0A5J9T7G4_9POAL|nr:hypothetical protein EJB05_46954 [Eragrostis curvula]